MGGDGKQGMVLGRGTFFEALAEAQAVNLDFCLLLGAAVFLQVGRQ